MPFDTIYSAHITVFLQYIKPSESTLYLSNRSSKTMVLLTGANIEITVNKSILSNIILRNTLRWLYHTLEFDSLREIDLKL